MTAHAREAGSATLARLVESVRQAHAEGVALRIVGGDTKRAWWSTAARHVLSLAEHRGIVDYAPSELVVVARAGTPLVEIEEALAARGQMLGFEPPRTGDGSTIGGVIAAGIAGPARPYLGAVRDFVLGVKVLDSSGEVLSFGGRVMKNVAGYDVSRLFAASWGRLGPIVEVALRATPIPPRTTTLRWRSNEHDAWQRLRGFARQPLPISGCRQVDGHLDLRLAGAAAAIDDACARLRPEAVEEMPDAWARWRDLADPNLQAARWRVVVPPATPPLSGDCVAWDWGGALRWYGGPPPADAVREAGGHGAPFPEGLSHPNLEPALRALTERVREAFDPHRLFNPVST
ncbi:MAG: glycolate oxidase subunit GlcE [Gammaproteobacteria bacterium]